MKTKSVKRKINQLLTTYTGAKLERYEKLAADLFCTPRWIIYLKDGKKEANIHLATAIDSLLEKRK